MTFLHKILATEDESFNWKDFADCIEDWVSRPNQISFLELADMASQLDKKSPLKQKEYAQAYRGIELTPQIQKKLDSGKKLKVAPGSWSFDEDEAKRFAEGYSAGLVIERWIKPADVILNLKACIEDPNLSNLLAQSTKDTIKTEGEIILKGFLFGSDDVVWTGESGGESDDDY